MEETSHPEEERPDIKTRWKKGQSGNPQGRPRLSGAGLTLTALARTMMERPVEGVDGGRRTRLAEYMFDVVRRADAGDLKCRMFLLKTVDHGDRRRETAQRNAKKAKSEELRKFEEAKADEIAMPVAPLTPEQEEEHLVKDVRPTAPPRKPTATPAREQPEVPPRKTQPEDASTYRRDADGHLVTPEGRVLSPEEENRLTNPYWPHVSPHLKKAPPAGATAGDSAGPESPVPENQVVDSARDFGSEIFPRKSTEADREGTGRVH